VLLAAAVGLGLLPSAQAASVTITLSLQRPSPPNAAAVAGDTIIFSNTDQVAHAVKSTSGAWSFSSSVAAGARYNVKLPTQAGTFTYSDTHNVPLFGTTVDSGIVTATAPKAPPPSATTSPKPGVTASRTPSPKPTTPAKATATAQPSATPSGTPTPGSGTALAPGLGTGILTTGTPAPGAPQPNIAPLLPDSTANPADPVAGATAAPPVKYADRPLTQDSSHRYGLPALLAVLLLTGVGSLLVRYLLADGPPQPPQD
jgi:hypothetical protein